MRFTLSGRALRDYQKLSSELKKTADKQFYFLLKDTHHPSLRAKKYDEGRGVWQARITGSHRVYFEIKEDYYIFHEIRSHAD